MDCPGCGKEEGRGSEVTGGSGMLGWGVGVMSMGVSCLRSWRSLIVVSKLSSFCSTMVEDSFFSMETTFSSMAWLSKPFCLMLSLMTILFLCIISNSFELVSEMVLMALSVT